MKMVAIKFCVILLLHFVVLVDVKCVELDGGCVYFRREVNCKNLNLSYIPEIPTNVSGLVFTDNFLPNVKKETFINITNQDYFFDLRLSYNKIHTISKDSFDIFPRLKYLELTGNYIENVYLKPLLGVLCHRKLALTLNSMGHNFASPDTFSLMNECDLDELYLKKNRFVNISRDMVKHFDSVQVLYLNHNKIKNFELSYMRRVDVLSIAYNYLTQTPNFCMVNDSSLSYVPKITSLFIKYNRIMEIHSENFKCLTTLTYLDLSGNYLTVFPNDMLLYMPVIHNLYISTNKGHSVHAEQYAFRSKSLGYLELSLNGPADLIFPNINDTFKYSTNLTYLTLGYISMQYLPISSLHGLFAPLGRLRNFTCYGCQIQRDPSIILWDKENLTKINLDINLIDKINTSLMTSKKYLKFLHLSKNKLAHLSSTAFPIDFLNKLEKVDFSGNPFSCDCALEWFINWLKTANRSNIQYIQRYTCASPQKYVGKSLLDVKFSYFECHPLQTWMWILIIGVPTLIVISVISLILYRNRWNIKHYIYLCRKRKNYTPIDGKNLLYDAFVSYNQADSDWIFDVLVPTLETESDRTLCVHERDFHVGTYINDNIVQRIEESKRMILILSNAFATSGWCMFELKVALSKHIEDEFEIIVVLLEPIKGRNLNNSIKTLLDITTYLEWTQDAVGVDLFWNKLRDAMGVERLININ